MTLIEQIFTDSFLLYSS